MLTPAGTLLVIALELTLLLSVYHRGDGVHTQRAEIAQVWGTAQAAPGLPAARAVQQALPELRKAGLGDKQLDSLSQAADQLAKDPQSQSQQQQLSSTVKSVSDGVNRHQHNLGIQAALLYGGMLVIASVGWFIWFRRLVQRQRGLERELTEQKAVADSKKRLQALVQNSHDVILVIDADSTVTFASPSLSATVGIEPEAMLGHKLLEILDDADTDALIRVLGDQESGEESTLSSQLQHADGRLINVEGVVTNLLADESVGGYVVTFRDVTEEHALRARLTRQAFYDSLTGLANRQLFANRLQHALSRRAFQPAPLIVLFCDLDDFKLVNDSHGHPVGDQVLRLVAARISESVRPGDTAARFGGDEFAVLMEGANLAEAEVVAGRVIEALATPMIDETGVAWEVTASIGIAQAIAGTDTAEDALRNADVAMYWAKDRGKSTVAVYDPNQHALALDRLQLRAELQQALRDEELVLHYQPTVRLDTNTITGFEALVRWQHPTRGLLPPAMFIEVAEQAGLIQQLGSWVLRTACRTAAELQVDHRQPSMSVNVSAQQLASAGFVGEVRDALAESGLAPHKLTLEITETMLLADIDSVSVTLMAVQQLGVRIAVDDFGTGYSSLAYLNRLPVDVLKVDKTFVDDVASDPQSASVTHAVIAMAKAMNLRTIAEGVEQSEQAQWLLDANCEVGQGYLWSRPLPLAEIKDMLAESPAPVDVPSQRVAEDVLVSGQDSGRHAESPLPL